MTIRMIGMVDLVPMNDLRDTGRESSDVGERNNTPMFREMIKNTERALGLTEDKEIDQYLRERRRALKLERKEFLRSLVKEELAKLQEELEKTNKKIAKGLEDIRKEYATEMFKRVRENGANFQPALEKRIHINTVAEMLEVGVNELMLYFLNNVKHTNERQLVEYRQGHVTFYAN